MNKIASVLLLKTGNKNSRAGFTLVEILLVVAILGILAGVAVQKFSGYTKKANIQAARISIGAIKGAVDRYEIDNGIYPASLQALITRGNESNWNGPYLEDKGLKDPWGNDFTYSVLENSVKIASPGPDGQAGSADDITN